VLLVRVLALEPELEPEQALVPEPELEPELGQGLEPEPALELGQGLGLHRQLKQVKSPALKQSKH